MIATHGRSAYNDIWDCTPPDSEIPPLGNDADFDPLCFHAEDAVFVDFYYHDLITGLKKHYDDYFTLNVVGKGETWHDLAYFDERLAATLNPLCEATDQQNKEFHSMERILDLSKTGAAFQ